jgi:hypothetical protein
MVAHELQHDSRNRLESRQVPGARIGAGADKTNTQWIH